MISMAAGTPNYRSRHLTDTQQQPPSVPESVRRLMEYAGKQRREVSNPCITANEAIVIANHFSAYGREQAQQESTND